MIGTCPTGSSGIVHLFGCNFRLENCLEEKEQIDSIINTFLFAFLLFPLPLMNKSEVDGVHHLVCIGKGIITDEGT